MAENRDLHMLSVGGAEEHQSKQLSWWAGALLLAFILHNWEEVVGNEARMSVVSGDGPLGHLREMYRTDRFILAVAVLTIVVFAALLPITLRRTRGAERWALLATGALIANAMTHIGQAIAVRTSNPGLISAVVLVLPIAVAVAVLVERESDRTRSRTVRLLLTGAIGSIPAIIGALALSAVIFR